MKYTRELTECNTFYALSSNSVIRYEPGAD